MYSEAIRRNILKIFRVYGKYKINFILLSFFPSLIDGLPFRHQNISLSSEYDYQQAIAQHAAAVNAANSSSLHSAMAQIPTLPAALNLTVNSVNQGYSSSGLSSSLGNSNAAYHYSYGSLGSSGGSGSGNNMVGQHHVGHVGHHHAGGGKSKKKYKLNKDGVPPPKRATTAYIHFTQWYREELKRSGREIPKVSISIYIGIDICMYLLIM